MIAVSRNIFIEAPVERVFALMADPAARVQREREEALVNRLEGNLGRWLVVIKQHLESGRG